MTAAHRVAIVGGGFAGLEAARALATAAVEVTLVDRRNFHLFQPLLYQVATGGLSPANIAAPLRTILRDQGNARVLLAEVRGFDPSRRRVLLADGELEYDTLMVAAGMRNSWFGRADWEARAPGLKSIEDATRIRGRVLAAFEAAERATDEASARELLTFVVVGGGPTGVELAGTLGEIARYTLRHEFRRIDPLRARIVLVEAGPRVLPVFSEAHSAYAVEALAALGVETRLGTRVEAMDETGVVLRRGAETERVATRTVLWAAGVSASPLGLELAKETGAATDPAGRVKVAPDLSVPGHPDIFVLGDLAWCDDATGHALPGVAPVAMQQGRHAAATVRARIEGGALPPPFRYRDPGIMATIGRRSAVARLWGRELTGPLAWMAWLFVHLLQLVRFENRTLVLLQWAWNYLTFSRSARLIT